MLDNGFELVQRLIELRFVCLQRAHFGIQRGQLRIVRGRERRDPIEQRGILLLFVACRLQKRRDIAGEALAEIVDQAHFDDLVHIERREFVLHKECHQCKPPAVLGDAFAAAPARLTMAQLVLEALSNM